MVASLLLVLHARSRIDATPEFTEVFKTGESGFQNIRIPSLVVTNHRVVLAFAEGRKGRESDQAQNKILLRSSSDLGRTWGPVQVIADDADNSLNNPCAVVDRQRGINCGDKLDESG